MNKRAKALEKQDWLEESTSSSMSVDPLGSIFERSRAERQGVPYVPEATPPPLTVVSSVSIPVAAPVAAPQASMAVFIAAANRSLSPSAFKVLLAVYIQGEGRYHASDLARLTFLNKDTVNNAVHECMERGWLVRRSECPQCGTEAVLEIGQKLIICSQCHRSTSPLHCYRVQYPDGISDTPNGFLVTHAEKTETHPQFPVTPSDGISDTPNGFPATPLTEKPLPYDTKKHAPSDGISVTPFPLSRLREDMRRSMGAGNSVTPPEKTVTPRARADSESVTRIRDSDSRIPPQSGSTETGRVVYASGEWQQITEKLAKDSAKRIGDKSVGFHVKVWAHARKVDWEQGGKRFEEGLFAIAQELEGKHNATGKSQGAMWTKMVRRYFEEKGQALLTEAETKEWEQIHGSYAPPTL